MTKDNVTVPDSSSPSLAISATGQPKVATAVSFKYDQRCTGTMTINGSLNGSSKSETVSISDNTIAQSMTRFDELTSIDFSTELTTLRPNVTIKYIDMGGSSVPLESDLIQNFPINLSRSKSELVIDKDGSVQHEMIKALLPYTNEYTPKEFDILTVDQTNEGFIVIGRPLFQQAGINTHWICNLKRYERS
tara:strand:+ start:299 stop:871 length:573 start_codon:yes stop_codon:yes gene_type:complete